MKKSVYKFAAAILCLSPTLCGCDKDDEAALSVSADELNFEAVGNKPQTITVTAENLAWSVSVIAGENTDAEPWISAEQASNTVTVKVADNPAPTARSGSVVIKSGNSSFGDKIVTVRQKGQSSDPSVIVEPDELFFNAENNRRQYAYLTVWNTKWEIEVEEGARSWMNVTPEYEKDRLAVDVDDNARAEIREGKVRIFGTGGSPEAILTVTQDAGEPVLSVDRTIAIFTAANPTSQTLTVTANMEWKAEAQAGDDWYDIEISGNELTVTAQDLGGGTFRRGKIGISGAGEETAESIEVEVMQGTTEKIDFVAGRICYYANEYENGTASYSVQLLSGNGYWTDRGENITNGWHAQIKTVAPGPEPPYDKFDIPVGTYVASESHQPYTFVPTYQNSGLTMGSTLYRFNNMPIPSLVTGLKEGYMTVNREGDKHTISITGITKENLIIDASFSDTVIYLDYSDDFPGYD